MAINKNKSITPILNRIQKPTLGAHTAGVQGTLRAPTPRIPTIAAPKIVAPHIVTVKFK